MEVISLTSAGARIGRDANRKRRVVIVIVTVTIVVAVAAVRKPSYM
jgi:hypothetical protein